MNKKRMIAAIVLGAALPFVTPISGVATAQTAEQQKAAEEKYERNVRRAHVVQIYLKSQDAVIALLDAEARYNVARAKGDINAMTQHAAEMFAASTVATYWAKVLDMEVSAIATREEPRELSARYLSLNEVVFTNLTEIVLTNDINDLNKRLDTTVARTLTELHGDVRRIYSYIKGQW